jgi:hypothetical protein
VAAAGTQLPPHGLAGGWGQPLHVEPLVYPNTGVLFTGPAYNANRTVTFTPPAGTTRVAVAAFITGHSGCEFRPTSHHFVLNERPGADFNTSRYLGFSTTRIRLLESKY